MRSPAEIKSVVDRLKNYYIHEESNLVEGEKVVAISSSSDRGIVEGDTGTVFVEFILELYGIPVGMYVIGVLIDRNGVKNIGPGLDDLWRSI